MSNNESAIAEDNEEYYLVKCLNCGEIMDENCPYDFEICEDEGGFFRGCPNCHTDEHFIDIAESEIEKQEAKP
jgi:hypothetical protein